MPFSAGTASIAELSLYTLSIYYLGSQININKNVMLDVEALTLPFNIFYENCFKEEPNNIYLPYCNLLSV